MKYLRNAGMLCIIFVAVCVIAGIQPTLIHGEGGAPGIEGTWLITVVPAGGIPPPFPSLVTYSAGGGMVITDSSFPPSQGNIYQGTWTRDGNHVVFSFLGFQFDAAGVHSGYVRVYETVTLAPAASSYSGTGVFQLLDLNGNVVFSEPDTTTAVRVSAK